MYGWAQLTTAIKSLTPSPPVVPTAATSRPGHPNNALARVAGSLIRQHVPSQQVEKAFGLAAAALAIYSLGTEVSKPDRSDPLFNATDLVAIPVWLVSIVLECVAWLRLGRQT